MKIARPFIRWTCFRLCPSAVSGSLRGLVMAFSSFVVFAGADVRRARELLVIYVMHSRTVV
ncbi:hypothetical protein AXK59_23660 [Tsukamurella tyrosinosolvens]|nr:hypothetical protein AXK59_23660 [Tsukamurella tyrosinosolvens]